jgi:hypothetical protein
MFFGLVGVSLLAPCPLQGGQVSIRMLVIGDDAARADVHASMVTVISDAGHHLILRD